MRIIVVGPGRAGLSIASAAQAAGHDIVAIVGKDDEQAQAGAGAVGARALGPGDALPPADLLVLATRDDDIAPVSRALAVRSEGIEAAVHLSGLASVETLDALAGAGLDTGSFHPLQTLPTPEAGAARLGGAWVAVTARPPLRAKLHALAASLGARPFDLADADKALYHAGAAAAANFPLLALTMARDMFESVGVPFEAARPLVEAVIANAFEIGPRPSLTGPVARGDVGTVEAQLDAIAARTPQWLGPFSANVLYLARLAGRGDDFTSLLERWRPDASDSPS